MKCLKEKELILFYYQELQSSRHQEVKRHLKECDTCSLRYRKIESLLKEVAKEQITLTSREVEEMVSNVKHGISRVSFWDKLIIGFNELAGNLRYKMAYRPQLAMAAVFLVVVLTVIPIANRQKALTEKDFSILQIEIELSYDSLEGSIFDLYEDDMSFMDETSRPGRPILGSRIEVVQRET